MRGIRLKGSIELFGVKDGFSFWFNWSFISPIQMWVWLNITHKPYCLYAGYHCNNKNCRHTHLTKRKDIIKEFKKQKIQAETIRGSEDGICVYCGKEKGTEEIDDPNWDTIERWLVCKNCKEIIEAQRDLSFGEILAERPFGRSAGEKMMREANDKLYDISQKTGIPILNASIYKTDKGYKTESVLFEGKENNIEFITESRICECGCDITAHLYNDGGAIDIVGKCHNCNCKKFKPKKSKK